MYVGIIKVKPLNDFRLLLKFDNGEEKYFDMKPYLDTGIFKDLKDLNLFNTVRVSFDSIEWANGADLDPEEIYKFSI